MSPRMMKVLSFFIISMLLVAGTIVAKDKDGDAKKVKGTKNIMGSPSRTHFNINNVSTWLYNDGKSDIIDGASGFIYPKGSNKAVVYQSGFVWGATINGEKRVGGSTYGTGLVPGRIIGNGATAVSEDETLDHVRIFRVRRDYANPDADFNGEINDGEGTKEEIVAQYELDWNNWPAQYGAPYEDVNTNGTYEPSVDIPGVVGADQTVWFVANDLDVAAANSLYGSNPMGIEMQATYWGYNQTNALGNMMFRKYKIINKSVDAFDSMYVSMWADPDLGDASDDFAGCDVDLSMMYTYNGEANDAVYGATPPAVGFDFFQGPVVPAPGETAIFDGKYKADYKNLPMSAHYFFINGDDVYTDPDLGNYVDGTLQFHNLFGGKVSSTGSPFVDPDGNQTKFTLSGDPVSGTGWIDGIQHQPGDRRQGMVAGPFTMAAGDTQEVVVSEMVAGAFEGVDRLGAVQLLKFYDLVAQTTYDNFFKVPATVPQPVVSIDELDNEVVLKWSDDPVVENYNSNGYQFQGYVVYQFPTKSSTLDNARIVSIVDKKDGIGSVFGQDFDTESGAVLVKLLKKGPDTGIKRYISLKQDIFKSGAKLNNGTPYYFGVTSYAVNPDDLTVVPTVLESAPIILEVIPQTSKVGFSDPVASGSDVEIEHTGTSNATVSVKAIEPNAITGDEYVVDFKAQHYYQDKDGTWKETNFPDSIGKSLSKDVSPSTLSGVAIYSPVAPGTIDLKYTLNLVSPTDAWVDGIELTLPAGVTINSVAPAHSNYSHDQIDFVQTGNTIFWGRKDLTGGGNHSFAGDEVLEINVQDFTIPMTASFVIYDDGYGSGGNPIDATGNVTVSEVGYNFRTENHWNLTNTTTGQVLLDKQRVFGGIDQYASFWNVPEFVGTDAAPIVDGIQVNVDGSFEAPINFLNLEHTGNSSSTTTLSSNSSTSNLDIQNYTIFSGVVSSYAIDNFGVGTYSLDELQQDYELRFTGVYDAGTVKNGVTVYQVVSGGSMATCFRMVSGAALATNPLNPNYGTADPFLIRIPFEVWNVDDPANPYQVNLTYRDRVRDGSEDPFWAWNPTNRMYALIVNTPYDADQVIQVDGGPDAFNDLATWVLVMYGTNYTEGGDDVVKINYANPIQFGKDSYKFTTQGVNYSKNQAKADIEKINVFPNPYYGVNPNEINKYQRYVTFNHLPPLATIRVFNLAGQLVKVVEKDDETQYARWSLTNEKNLPVASGIYIVYVDMPDLGETKVLKVAVIQETQILDRY